MHFKIYLVIAFISLNHIIIQSQTPSFVSDSLDKYVEQALKDWRIPGAAVAIIKDGKIVLTKGYGIKDIRTSEPVDEHSLFMIASNSKAVTGIAIAQLEYEKKLSINDKVTQWLPYFKLYDKCATEVVTIKDVLTHRIGFETFQGDFAHWTTTTSRQDIIKKMAYVQPKYAFRDKYGYCNAGYVVAGEIIEKASGMKWEDYITKNYFVPLGLTETSALTKDFAKSPNHCTPHTLYKDVLIPMRIPNIDNLGPAASICSSVSDWSKWLLMLLNEGKHEGKQIIPEKAIQRSMEAVSIRGPYRPRYNFGHFNLYGLGWVLQDYNGRQVVSHTGGADGFVTSVSWLPEEELGIIVLTNTDENQFYQALRMEIMDAYLGLLYRNYSKVYYELTTPAYIAKNKQIKIWEDSASLKLTSALPLTKYCGRYSDPVYGNMDIKQQGDQLIASFQHHADQHAVLQSLGGNRFLCTYSNPLLGIKVFPFTIKKNKVKSVTVSCADFVEFTTYEFMKK